MRFDKITPTEQLRPYIKCFIVSENEIESGYKVSPSGGLVIGFQYRGQLSVLEKNAKTNLSTAGITGISDSFKIFKNSINTASILVYFTETSLIFFTSTPANQLFNQSISLENIFDNQKIRETEEKLSYAKTDKQRIQIVELFLLSQFKDKQKDNLIVEAVQLIYQSKGTIAISEINKKLFISQSPFEKRFRKVVGASPKKFASIVRFNCVLDNLKYAKSLTDICYENSFFDQAHFIKNFKQFTGERPENFKRLL